MLFLTVCKTLQPVADTPGVLLVLKYVSGLQAVLAAARPGGEHHSGGSHHLAVTPFYSVMLPAVLPFWTPKKEAKKVPATSDSARLAAKTMAAIPQSGPARVLQSPTGALIAARPHSSPA